MIHMFYMVPSYNETLSDDVCAAVVDAIRAGLEKHLPTLETAMFSLSILKEEMHKNATFTIPYIPLTVFLLITFSVGSW
ncbi:unnamed protein product, partial [Mesorhabditis spiculigera]